MAEFGSMVPAPMPEAPQEIDPRLLQQLIPMWLQSGMATQPTQPQFPDAPPSRADAAYQSSIDRWTNLGEAAKNDPASVAQAFGGPGLAAATVLRAKDASDRTGQRGMLQLGAPPKRDTTIPPNAQETAGDAPLDLNALMGQRKDIVDQRKSVDAQRATAVAERDLQLRGGKDKSGRPVSGGRGPIYDAKEAEVTRLTGEVGGLDKSMERLDTMIAQAQKEQSPAYKSMMAEGDKAATARDTALGNRRSTYEEFAPAWLQNFQSWLPMATAATIHGGLEAVKTVKNNTAAGKWVDAIEAANAVKSASPTAKAASMARPAELSAQYAKEYPAAGGWSTAGKYGVATGAGAAEGAALSNTPEIYNSFLPGINQERQAWEQYLNALPADHPDRARAEKLIAGMPQNNPIQEAAINHLLSRAVIARAGEGALEGAIGATTGKTIVGAFNPTFPRPEAAALAKEFAGAKKAAKEVANEKAAAKAAKNQPAVAPELPTMSLAPPAPPAIASQPTLTLPPPSAPVITNKTPPLPTSFIEDFLRTYGRPPMGPSY